MTWISPKARLPERGSAVVWIAPTGEEVSGVYDGLWFLPGGMYVYYTPAFWKAAA